MSTIVRQNGTEVWGFSAFGDRLLTPGVIDESALEVYRHGSCALLALVLHDLTGWPLGLVRPTGLIPRQYSYADGTRRMLSVGWVHAVVWLPDGQVLDIAGAQPADDVRDYWDAFETSGPFSIHVVSGRQQYLNEVGTGWDDCDADRSLATSYAVALLDELEIHYGF